MAQFMDRRRQGQGRKGLPAPEEPGEGQEQQEFPGELQPEGFPSPRLPGFLHFV